jgi:hypothetical protein
MQAYQLSGFQPDSPVLECAVRAADETSNRTIECPVLAQMINQNYILIIKPINECGLVVRIADATLSRVLINIESLYVFNARTLTQNFKVEKLLEVEKIF